MSKPKYRWYGEVKRRIMDGDWEHPESFQDWIYSKAIYEALEETKLLPDAEERMQAIDEILIKHTKTYKGLALDIHRDWTVVQKWVTSFVNLVGKKAGN